MIRLVCFICLILLPKNSYSCDCIKLIGLEDADAVFVGTVYKIRKISNPTIEYIIKFKVEKCEKGSVSKRVKVITPCLLGACCGIEFFRKQKYQVFATKRDGMLFTNYCTKTKRIAIE